MEGAPGGQPVPVAGRCRPVPAVPAGAGCTRWPAAAGCAGPIPRPVAGRCRWPQKVRRSAGAGGRPVPVGKFKYLGNFQIRGGSHV